MKKLIALFFVTLSAHAADYTKKNGILTITPQRDFASFNLNTSNGDSSGVCEISGETTTIGTTAAQRDRWVYSDQSSQCVAIISELGDGTMQVITKYCDSYCGLTTIGSMMESMINN